MVGGEPHVGKPESDLPVGDLVLATTPAGGRDYHTTTDRVVDPGGSLTGVAPRATVRPIKFIDDVPIDIDRTGVNGVGVVRFCDDDLASAIDYARTSGAHVISLSVGGLMDDSVRVAIDRAVENGLIVVAAAGQTYFGPIVTAILGAGTDDSVILPAAYSNVLAVAGCSQDGFPWDESLRGSNVDITAPADAMWVAEYANTRFAHLCSLPRRERRSPRRSSQEPPRCGSGIGDEITSSRSTVACRSPGSSAISFSGRPRRGTRAGTARCTGRASSMSSPC